VDYIDIFTPMLDAKGQPDETLFIDDRLHMNAAGYDIWQRVIAQYVK
jgi:lysophospholipase L1-like esterase